MFKSFFLKGYKNFLYFFLILCCYFEVNTPLVSSSFILPHNFLEETSIERPPSASRKAPVVKEKSTVETKETKVVKKVKAIFLFKSFFFTILL